jgi:asparagine synthase (glutamine-hydrolysing)
MSIYSYLSYRQPIKNQTYFKNINSLEPGYYIEISKGRLKKKSYWDFEDYYKESRIDKGEDFYADKLKTILESSVKYRLNSDREVASLLSGGLDSSIISSLINQAGVKNFKAFSIGYSGEGYNEFKYSSIIAKKFAMNHRVIKSNSTEYFDDMEKLIEIKAQPVSIPNEVSQYRLCKEIKKHASVVLSGTGADEIFCGYGRIFGSVYDYNKLKSKNFFKNIKDRKLFINNFKKFYGVENFKNQVEHFNHLYSYISFKMKYDILSDSINTKKLSEKSKDFISEIFESSNSKNYLFKMQHFFAKYHLKGILERDDISSMAASVELRVPFLDHRMVEFSATIPEKYKIMTRKKNLTMISEKISEKYDIPKYILRKTFKDLIPNEILDRPKIGFPVPLHKWINEKKIKDRIYSVLTSSQSITRDIFDPKYIKKILVDKKTFEFNEDSRKYQSSLASTVWMCYNLELFLSKKN